MSACVFKMLMMLPVNFQLIIFYYYYYWIFKVKHLFSVFFLEDKENQLLCTQNLSQKDVEKLQHAIEELYYFEFVVGMSVTDWVSRLKNFLKKMRTVIIMFILVAVSIFYKQWLTL